MKVIHLRTPGRALPAVVGCAIAVLIVDVVPVLVPGTEGAASALDPVAHLATTLIVLVALRTTAIAFAAAALVASVAIDVDHIPQYLGWDGLMASNGRPYSHSAALVALLVAVALVSKRLRLVGAGAALGVALHLWRDLATGPGVTLLWPLAAEGVRFSYVAYGVPLAFVGALALLRAATTSR